MVDGMDHGRIHRRAKPTCMGRDRGRLNLVGLLFELNEHPIRQAPLGKEAPARNPLQSG